MPGDKTIKSASFKDCFKSLVLYLLKISLILSSQTLNLLILFFFKNFITEQPESPNP